MPNYRLLKKFRFEASGGQTFAGGGGVVPWSPFETVTGGDLPGQSRVMHGLVSVLLPTHGRPSSLGTGLSQRRVRRRVP